MTDHLAECYLSGPPSLCPMCDALRACEQRVRAEEHVPWHWQLGKKKRDEGYAAGLDAAHKAVAAVGVRKDTSHDMRVQALAAIDSLRATNP